MTLRRALPPPPPPLITLPQSYLNREYKAKTDEASERLRSALESLDEKTSLSNELVKRLNAAYVIQEQYENQVDRLESEVEKLQNRISFLEKNIESKWGPESPFSPMPPLSQMTKRRIPRSEALVIPPSTPPFTFSASPHSPLSPLSPMPIFGGGGGGRVSRHL
jgi:hypothetical protein